MTYIIQILSKAFTTSSLVLVGLIAMLSFVPSQNLAAEDGDVFTDIILINGHAVLADFNKAGIVLNRHVAVPDYFSSGRSHKRSLRNSLNKLKVYGSIKAPSPVFYHAPVECRQSLMAVKEVKTPVEDIATEVSMVNGLTELKDIINIEEASIALLADAKIALEDIVDFQFESVISQDLIIRSPKQRLKIYRRFGMVSGDRLQI